jgi:nucleotide-binding universal stress UspA family protein
MTAAARRLLVGLDDTPQAGAALRHAVRLARRNHGCLVLVCVVPKHASGVLVSPLGNCVAIVDDPQETAAELLRAARERVPDGVSVVTVMRRGRVGPVLADEAERFACDAIVVGAHCSLWSRLSGGVERYLRRHSQARLIVDHTGTLRPSRRRPPAPPRRAPLRVPAHPA